MEYSFVRSNSKYLAVLKRKYLENGETGFVEDGILCRGGVRCDDDGHWRFMEGDEDEIWANAPRRILIVDKYPDGECTSLVYETGQLRYSGAREAQFPLRFYRNILRAVHGFEITTGSRFVSFDEFTMEDAVLSFDTAAVARINLWKSASDVGISDRSLRQHLKRYEEDIRMQMDILDPDIILCCSGVVFDTVMSVCFNDEYETNDPRLSWIHYLAGDRKRIVVNSYHPAYCGISESFFYNEMMKDYHGFLRQHPEYQSFR